MVKPPLRTKSVGTKVSDTEYAALEARARASGLTLSEWVRDVLLASSPEAATEAGTQVVLGELLALRTVMLNLLFSIGSGQPVTVEGMQQLVERANKDKVRRALAKLAGVRAEAAVSEAGPESESGEQA